MPLKYTKASIEYGHTVTPQQKYSNTGTETGVMLLQQASAAARRARTVIAELLCQVKQLLHDTVRFRISVRP